MLCCVLGSKKPKKEQQIFELFQYFICVSLLNLRTCIVWLCHKDFLSKTIHSRY